MRPAQGPDLRDCASRRRNTPSDRPPSRPAGGHARGLARRAARHRDHLPRPGFLLRRWRHPRRPAGPPGRRPMAPLAQPGGSRREVRLPAPRLPATHADTAGGTSGGRRASHVVSLADRAPVRRTHPRQARHHPRSPRRRAQQAVRRPATRNDPQHDLALLPRHHPGGDVHRPVAKPCDQAGRLQALPRPALAGRLHQRLETVGGDQGTELSPGLRKRPGLRQQDSSRQAPASRSPAAIGPSRHALDPHPPRRSTRRRPAPAQSHLGQLPRTDSTRRTRALLRSHAHPSAR